MRFKTLLVCFLAVCAVSLTSCKKEKNEENYAKNFVGSYEMSIIPTLSLEIMNQQLELISGQTINGVTCDIAQVGNSQDVTVSINIPELGMPAPFVMNATCSADGMALKDFTMPFSIPVEEMGSVDLSLTLGGLTVAAPVNGKISWTSGISGTASLNVGGIPVAGGLTGNIIFDGTKK